VSRPPDGSEAEIAVRGRLRPTTVDIVHCSSARSVAQRVTFDPVALAAHMVRWGSRRADVDRHQEAHMSATVAFRAMTAYVKGSERP
jgi:hypothetical protein